MELGNAHTLGVMNLGPDWDPYLILLEYRGGGVMTGFTLTELSEEDNRLYKLFGETWISFLMAAKR